VNYKKRNQKFFQNRFKELLKLSLATLLFLMIFQNIFAASVNTSSPRLYQIEVIVFSKITNRALLAEQWQIPQNIPDTSNAIELGIPASMQQNSNFTISPNVTIDPSAQPIPIPYQILTPKTWQLNKEASRLAKHGYVILLHTAWLQSFDPKQKSPLIHLYGGHAWTPDGKQLSLTPALAFPVTDPTSFNWEMNGTIRITLNRYFNVHLNLLLAEPSHYWNNLISNDHPFKNIVNNFAYFDLKQTRRMKSNELNYIEHPLYSVLIQISSYPISQNAHD